MIINLNSHKAKVSRHKIEIQSEFHSALFVLSVCAAIPQFLSVLYTEWLPKHSHYEK